MHIRFLRLSSVIWALLLLVPGSVLSDTTDPTTPDAATLRIRGRVIETHSRKPLKEAFVKIKSGEKVIASKLTNKDGSFSLDIPGDLLSTKDKINLSIEFMDHIFLKNDLEASSQDMVIEINGEVLLNYDPIADYKLPIHVLNKPEVGTVSVRLKKLTPKNNSTTDEV